MIERVYIETSFVSYWTARPSRDLIVAGHQQITHDWWGTEVAAEAAVVGHLRQVTVRGRHQAHFHPKTFPRRDLNFLSSRIVVTLDA